jgi:PAS domain S-box-containing protein
VLDINPSAIEILGYESRDGTIGKNAVDVVHPDDFADVSLGENIETARRDGVVRAQRRFRRSDGQYVPFAVTIKFVEATGHRYIIFRDDTERRRAEKEIRSLLRQKELLLSEVHHRIKNNMAMIASLLNLREREIVGVVGEDDDRSRERHLVRVPYPALLA